MGKKTVYFILGLLAFGFRLFQELQSSIVTGINGGYYPVQVRSILEHGHLAMNDMPFVFYVNALLVKSLAWLFPSQPLEALIIFGIKILGALSIPLVVIPLYKIINNYLEYKPTKLLEYSLVTFVLFSFSPLYLSAEMMKNAYAIVGFTYFLYLFLCFFKCRSVKHGVLMLLSLIFIAFTHFGVLAISIIFLFIYLVSIYKVKALVPILVMAALGFLVVWWLDPFRAYNAINIFEEWFGLPWRIAFYPAGIAGFIFSVLISVALFFSIRNDEVAAKQKQLITIFLWFIVVLSIPLLRFELWRRFNLMLFIPQTIALLLVFPYLIASYQKKFVVLLCMVSILSIIYNLIQPKQSSISTESYKDLAFVADEVSNPEQTIIMVRHGLDWWIVWQLKTKIAQSHIKVDKSMVSKYKDIMFLRQNKGHNDLYPGPGSPFFNPSVPKNSILLYKSDYFELYKRTD